MGSGGWESNSPHASINQAFSKTWTPSTGELPGLATIQVYPPDFGLIHIPQKSPSTSSKQFSADLFLFPLVEFLSQYLSHAPAFWVTLWFYSTPRCRALKPGLSLFTHRFPGGRTKMASLLATAKRLEKLFQILVSDSWLGVTQGRSTEQTTLSF